MLNLIDSLKNVPLFPSRRDQPQTKVEIGCQMLNSTRQTMVKPLGLDLYFMNGSKFIHPKKIVWCWQFKAIYFFSTFTKNLINWRFVLLQRILLHSDGKICQTSSIRRCEKCWRFTCWWRFRVIPGAQLTLQQKQSHRGMGPSGSWNRDIALTYDFFYWFFAFYIYIIAINIIINY